MFKLAKPQTQIEDLDQQITAHKQQESSKRKEEKDSDSEDSWTREPLNFKTIREFFDHMKIEPKDLDGLGLENLIRDVVNNEVSSLRTQL